MLLKFYSAKLENTFDIHNPLLHISDDS